MKRFLLWGLVALLFATPCYAADVKVSALPDGTVASTWHVVCQAAAGPTTSKCTVSSLLALKIGTTTNGKVCLADAGGIIQCTTDAYQTVITRPVTGPASPTANNLVKFTGTGQGTDNTAVILGTMTNAKWCSYNSTGTLLSCTENAPQAALTNPVTGVASPTAGYLTKWGVSGNAIVDGPKLGTLTDAKWCTFTTADGLKCTENAPSGAVPTTITVADEAADASSFPLFVTAPTGDLGPKTDTAFTYDPTTGTVGATKFAGAFNGTIGATTPAAGSFTTVTANSFTSNKSSGVAGDMGLYEANSTDTHAAGFRGPASITGDGAYRILFPNARAAAAGSLLSVTNAGESGTGTAADPYVQTGSWIAMDTDLSSVSASDDTFPSAKATKTALDLKAPVASPTFTGVVTTAGASDCPTIASTAQGTANINIDGASACDYNYSNGASAATYTPVITAPPAANKVRYITMTFGGGAGVVTLTATNITWIGTAGAAATTTNKKSTYVCIIPASGNALCKIVAEAY